MLEELRNFKYSPTKEGIIYFLYDIIGNNKYDAEVLELLCAHAPGIFHLSSSHLLLYCLAFNWVLFDEDKYYLSEEIKECAFDKKIINNKIIKKSISSMFEAELLNTEMFVYESEKDRIRFKNELFSLEYSSVRNTLICQGFFEVERTLMYTNFYLSDEYINLVSEKIKDQKKKISIEQLKKVLENNEIAGDLAEKYVLNYERMRLPEIMKDRIRIISSIDVKAGYDIISFQSSISNKTDRFIEVKAVSQDYGFYWSTNEYEVAKLKGTKYFLYLVNLEKIKDGNYVPMIICDPANYIMKSNDWLVETQDFRIRYVYHFLEGGI